MDEEHGEEVNEEHGEEVDEEHGEEVNEEHGEEVDEEHGEVKSMGRREPFNLLRTCVPYSPLQQPTEHSSGTHQPVLPCTTAQDSAGWG